MARILIVNQYFPPDTAATAEVFADIACSLRRAGHRVFVLSGHPSYAPRGKTQWKLLRTIEMDIASVEQVGSTAASRESNIGRAINYLSYLFLASLRAVLQQPPDVTVAGSDPPLAILAALLAAKGRPVIYSVQDLHPDLGIASGWIRSGIGSEMWGGLHTLALRKATRVVCLGEAMAQRVLNKGVNPQKVMVIPHGAPSQVGSPDLNIVKELRHGVEFLVLHAGNIGWGGAWESIIDASRILGEEATFLFVGDGVKAKEVADSGARVIPFRPHSEIASVMQAGDLQLVTVRPGAEGLVVPSKMYSILAHGRPILAVAPRNSEVARLVEQGTGLLADPQEPLDIVEKVRWAKEHPRELTEMSRRALTLASEIRREDQLERLVSLVEELAARSL